MHKMHLFPVRMEVCTKIIIYIHGGETIIYFYSNRGFLFVNTNRAFFIPNKIQAQILYLFTTHYWWCKWRYEWSYSHQAQVCRISTSYTALLNVVAIFEGRCIIQNKILIWYSYESKFWGEYNSNVSKNYSYVTICNEMLFFWLPYQ